MNPCPKCGAEEKYITIGSWYVGMWGKETHYALCEKCGFIVESKNKFKSIIEIWNEVNE